LSKNIIVAFVSPVATILKLHLNHVLSISGTPTKQLLCWSPDSYCQKCLLVRGCDAIDEILARLDALDVHLIVIYFLFDVVLGVDGVAEYQDAPL
jgi:hypothetical protein